MTTTGRIPTTSQAERLRSLATHPARIEGGKVRRDAPQDAPNITRATLESLARHRWVELPEGDGAVEVTAYGALVRRDRENLDLYQSLPYQEAARVRVVPRRLGGSPIRGWGGSRVGRSVHCRTCQTQALAERERIMAEVGHQSYPDPVVWFTNESNAQREAEINAGEHYRKHIEGDLPPFEETP